MNKHERNTTALWEMLALFALLASIGSAYHGQWFAAIGYLVVFLGIVYEKPIKRWFRRLRY